MALLQPRHLPTLMPGDGVVILNDGKDLKDAPSWTRRLDRVMRPFLYPAPPQAPERWERIQFRDPEIVHKIWDWESDSEEETDEDED